MLPCEQFWTRSEQQVQDFVQYKPMLYTYVWRMAKTTKKNPIDNTKHLSIWISFHSGIWSLDAQKTTFNRNVLGYLATSVISILLYLSVGSLYCHTQAGIEHYPDLVRVLEKDFGKPESRTFGNNWDTPEEIRMRTWMNRVGNCRWRWCPKQTQLPSVPRELHQRTTDLVTEHKYYKPENNRDIVHIYIAVYTNVTVCIYA